MREHLALIGVVCIGCSPAAPPPSNSEQSSAPAVLQSIRLAMEEHRPKEALVQVQIMLDQFNGTPQADTMRILYPEIRNALAAADSAEMRRRLAAKWTYNASEDPMSGRASRTAQISSQNTVSFSFPYEGAQHGTLTLRTHPQYGRDVYLDINKGQFLCTSFTACRVMVRFDESPAEAFSGAGPADNSTTTVFIRNHDRFLQRLRRAQRVRIQVNVYQEGAPVFEFLVGGFDADRYAGRK